MNKFDDLTLNEKGFKEICSELLFRVYDMPEYYRDLGEEVQKELSDMLSGLESNPLEYFKSMADRTGLSDYPDKLVIGIMVTSNLLYALANVKETLDEGKEYLFEYYFIDLNVYKFDELLKIYFKLYTGHDVIDRVVELYDLYCKIYFEYSREIFIKYYKFDDNDAYVKLLGSFLENVNYYDVLSIIHESIKKKTKLEYNDVLKSRLELILFKICENINEIEQFSPLLDLDRRYACHIYDVINNLLGTVLDSEEGFDTADHYLIDLEHEVDFVQKCINHSYTEKEAFMKALCITIGIDLATIALVLYMGKPVCEWYT